MRKLLAALLAGAMIFTLSACTTPSESAGSQPEPADQTESIPADPPQEPEPTEEPTPDNINLLTGEATLTPEAVGKRPVAVMINNAEANLPQYGISQADLIFEIPVEGDVTRLMAMYGDYTQVPEVCSIRSCRYYYPILSTGFDAVYIHWGMDPTVARRTLEELGTDNIDGNYGTYNLFDRDQARLDEGYALEHTSRLDGPALASAFAENAVRTDLAPGKTDPAFLFAKESAAAGESCTDFRIDFGANSGWGYYSNFSYDEGRAVYLKTHNDNPHIDGKTDEQLAFTNVLFLETPVGYLPGDNSGRREIDVTGDNKPGLYITGGKSQRITWSKSDAEDALRLYNANGDELAMNSGKTYIAVCAEGGFRTDY